MSYPEQLPVSREIDSIRQMIMSNQLIIVCGETGSGKTTQLPKLLYAMGLADNGIIGHTQPRKVAARTIMHRINHELREANKDIVQTSGLNPAQLSAIDIVGYKVRFQDKTQKHTAIKLMTDGILLQEIGHDRYLRQYSALIIDEAHERSLNIDFILGYLKTILPKRPDLKVIITSATIDNQKLSKYFNNAPVINVEGKTYPVDIVYQDYAEDNDLNNAIFQAISSCFAVEQGNVLVFLPGEREIKDCISYLRKTTLKRNEILPLFSRQNEAEQNLVFTENGKLKIIVTTNVAETSLTIPGIKFVIDSGIARVKRYNVRSRVEQLMVEPISKASSRQRAGRAGRTSHGLCIRLFEQADFNLRQEFTDPEIIRSNLANVILRLIGLRLGDPLTFPFLDMPQNTAYTDGFKTLFQLGALAEDNGITTIGKQLIKIPLDANLARILIAAAREFDCIGEALIVVSFLAIIDPREVPLEYQQQARERQSIWANKKSDFIVILNLWNWYNHEVQHKKSHKKLQEQCYGLFLSYPRMREWHELHGQLKEIMLNLGYTMKSHLPAEEGEMTGVSDEIYQRLHQALLSGFLNNIGLKDLVEDVYTGTNAKKFIIHPASQIDKAKWIVSATLSLTTRLYARTNAYIESRWLLPLTKHLAKYNYSNESWDKKRGEVVAIEHVLFGGLEIAKNKVAFGKLNPGLAREVFIKQGVVLNELGKSYKFIEHNLEVIDSLEELEDKLRLSFIIMEDELFEFYTQIIPSDICDIRSFDLWCKTNQNSLCINKDHLIKKLVSDNTHTTLYPDYILVNNNKLKLSYIFNPDSPIDGVSATIFLDRLGQITEESFSYLVPGLIRDKISFIIKALPKSIRVTLNPVNEFITKFLEHCGQNGDFASQLSSYLQSEYRIEIKVSEINAILLPKHLRFHFQIIDKNKILGSGDNLQELKHQLAAELNKLINIHARDFEQKNITTWLAELDNLLQPVNKSLGYLSLMVKDGQIDLVVIPDITKANINTRKGLLQLIKCNLIPQIKYLEQKRFNNFTQTAMYLKDVYVAEQLLKDSIDFILRMSVDLNILPQNLYQFTEVVENVKKNIISDTLAFADVLFNIGKSFNQVKLKSSSHELAPAIELQLDDLVYPDFLRYTRYNQLQHFPRYLQTILKRLEKYTENRNRDRANANEINALYDAWYNYIDNLEQSLRPVPKDLYDFKYKIEELRVSLFAQELKTPYPVSLKRLWRELEEFDK